MKVYMESLRLIFETSGSVPDSILHLPTSLHLHALILIQPTTIFALKHPHSPLWPMVHLAAKLISLTVYHQLDVKSNVALKEGTSLNTYSEKQFPSLYPFWTLTVPSHVLSHCLWHQPFAKVIWLLVLLCASPHSPT